MTVISDLSSLDLLKLHLPLPPPLLDLTCSYHEERWKVLEKSPLKLTDIFYYFRQSVQLTDALNAGDLNQAVVAVTRGAKLQITQESFLAFTKSEQHQRVVGFMLTQISFYGFKKGSIEEIITTICSLAISHFEIAVNLLANYGPALCSFQKDKLIEVANLYNIPSKNPSMLVTISKISTLEGCECALHSRFSNREVMNPWPLGDSWSSVSLGYYVA